MHSAINIILLIAAWRPVVSHLAYGYGRESSRPLIPLLPDDEDISTGSGSRQEPLKPHSTTTDVHSGEVVVSGSGQEPSKRYPTPVTPGSHQSEPPVLHFSSSSRTAQIPTPNAALPEARVSTIPRQDNGRSTSSTSSSTSSSTTGGTNAVCHHQVGQEIPRLSPCEENTPEAWSVIQWIGIFISALDLILFLSASVLHYYIQRLKQHLQQQQPQPMPHRW